MRRRITALYLLLLAVAVLATLRAIDWRTLLSMRIDWRWVTAATMLAAMHRAWGVVTWSAVLRLLGATSLGSWWTRARIWSMAWMGRYVPGKVGWIAAKVYFGNRLGLTSGALMLGAFVEVVQQLALTLLLSSALLAACGMLGVAVARPLAIVSVTIAGVAAALHPAPYRILMRLAARLRVTGAEAAVAVSPHVLRRSAGYQVVAMCLSGASYVLLTRSVMPGIGPAESLAVFASFTFAGAVGMLAVFAPSGIGVREGVLIVLLTQMFPVETTLALAVLGRVWSMAVDVGFYAVTHAHARMRGTD